MGERPFEVYKKRGGESDVLKQLLSVCSLGRFDNKWRSNKNGKKNALSVNF